MTGLTAGPVALTSANRSGDREALTASDRPYKKQFTKQEALNVLKECADDNWLNGELVELFVREKLYELALPESAQIPAREAPPPPKKTADDSPTDT